MAYRNDLDTLHTRQTILETEVAEREQELATTRRMIDEVQTRAKLPVLANLRVAAPCTAAWNAMTPVNGEDRVRACADCNKHVYNVSDMTRDEAEALIIAKEGKLCVRYFQRTDGTILLKDCAIGVKQRRRRRIVAAGAAVLAATGAFGVAAKYREDRDAFEAMHQRDLELDESQYMMGVMAMPTTPPPPEDDAVKAQPGAEDPAPAHTDDVIEIKGRM